MTLQVGKASPLSTNRFLSGLYTQRSLLRDPSPAYAAGSRMEALYDGVNIELSNDLTLDRAPGSSPYSSVTSGSAIESFYSFRQFTGMSEMISVITDSATTVKAVTPTSGTTIFTKSSGAGQTTFQSVGNILYLGNGVDQKAYQPGDQRFNNTVRNWGIAQTGGSSATYAGTGADGGATAIAGSQSAGPAAWAGAAGPGTANWEDPATGSSSGNLPARTSIVGTDTSNYLQMTEFDAFSIPTGATITGIVITTTTDKVNLEDGGSITDNTLYLLKNAVQEGSNMASGSAWADDATDGPQNRSYGGSSNLWGGTWTPANINNTSGFGFQISVTGTNANAYFYALSVTVYYTVSASTASWSNPTNAQGAPNSTFATSVINSVTPTNPLNLTNYGFAIPAGAVVSGIKVDVTDKYTISGGSEEANIVVGILINGATIGFSKSYTAASSSSETIPLGSTNDTWGTSITGAQANNSTFGVQITSNLFTDSQSGTVGIDAAHITITYLSAPTIALHGSGSLSASTGYTYRFSYVNTVSGASSIATPASASSGAFASNSVDVTVTASTDTQVNAIWIYRTTDGGSTYYRLPNTYANANATINDATTDAQLITTLRADVLGLNAIPPAGLIAPTYYQNRMWGAVGNVVYYSSGPDLGFVVGNGNEGFYGPNTFTFPAQVTRLVPTTQGLLVFTVSDTYIIYGNGSPLAASTTSSIIVYYPAPFLPTVGLLSYFSLGINGTTIYLFTTDKQLISLEPSSGVSEIGFPVSRPPVGFAVGEVPTLADFDPGDSYVTWHISGSDKAIYVSDGETGWFRCNTSQAPDGNFVWSPKRNIVGGCQAVQSIETSPGVHQLLIGPGSTGGAILARNSGDGAAITATSLTSNVATYTADNTFVLGQRLNITGCASSTYNVSNAVIVSVSATNFTIAITHANIASASESAGFVTLACTDNGVSYPSNLKLGSVILAEPGELAKVTFITADFTRVGTSPVVSILLNETKGTFENISNYVHSDPPSLYGISGAPTSLYSNRYECVQTVTDNENETPNAAWARSMQIEIDFGSTDVVQNSLMTLTIFGFLYEEV